jgi:hypothetical protein
VSERVRKGLGEGGRNDPNIVRTYELKKKKHAESIQTLSLLAICIDLNKLFGKF